MKDMISNKDAIIPDGMKNPIKSMPIDDIMSTVKFAQGLGTSLRMASELRSVKQVGRLPFLKSSNLHEDVLRGNLGPGNGFKNVFGEDEETGAMSRMAYKL